MSIGEARPRLSRVVWVVAGAVAALLLATAGRYGIFRDELYYLMCADHPAWGYVDHPPLAMVFLTVWKAVCGDSLLALRVPPALLAGAIALGAGLIAREMRGGAAAQVLAVVAVGLVPGVLGFGSFYGMNAFDAAFWVLTAWIACRILDPETDRRWWWALGAAVGLGLLNKYSMLFLTVGLGVGLLLSSVRRELWSRRGLAGAGIAAAILLPHLLWQIRADWPTVEFIRNAHGLKNAAMAPGVFWAEQLLMAHPLYAPLWLGGVLALFFMPRLRPWRPLGTAFVVVGFWLTVQNAKPYYLVPAYPMVMAAGAVAVTQLLGRRRRVAAAAGVALPLVAIAAGLVVAPLAIPLLSPEHYVAWEQTLGLRPRDMEATVTGDLPQHFADRFGWEELGRTVHDVAAALSPADRAVCLVVTGNYGECGAVNRFGLPAGMRPAVSGHNSCHSWWPKDFAPEIVLMVGGPRERVADLFKTVEPVAIHRHSLAMPYEREITVWVCRGPRLGAAEARERSRAVI